MIMEKYKTPSRNFEEIIETSLQELYEKIPDLYAYTYIQLNEYKDGYPEKLIQIPDLPDGIEVREVAFGFSGGDWNILYIIAPVSLKEFMLFFQRLKEERDRRLGVRNFSASKK
jgi:hypothetical protein